jgi:hypothetical protein
MYSAVNADSHYPGRFVIGYHSTQPISSNAMIQYNSNVSASGKSLNEIASIFPHSEPTNVSIEGTNKTLYPVLTLATCTGYEQIMSHDSFVILRQPYVPDLDYTTSPTIVSDSTISLPSITIPGTYPKC